MTCEILNALSSSGPLGDWLLIATVGGVSLGLGAFWQSKHAAAREINQIEQLLKQSVALRDDLRTQSELIHAAGESTTAYRFGRQPAERIAR